MAHTLGLARGVRQHCQIWLSRVVTMKKTAKRKSKIDWSYADAMTAKQRRAAALADPDNRPMTADEWAAAPRVPQVSIIRRALKMSQEDFAGAFHIPIGTLRDWE